MTSTAACGASASGSTISEELPLLQIAPQRLRFVGELQELDPAFSRHAAAIMTISGTPEPYRAACKERPGHTL